MSIMSATIVWVQLERAFVPLNIYLIKNTVMTITSITHALNTPPIATGITLDSRSWLFTFAIDIKKCVWIIYVSAMENF